MNNCGTITVDEATDRPWDAIVIGTGPAGAVAAQQLSIRGLSTLLVERHGWPRQKVCGGCVNGRAISILRAIGLQKVLCDSQGVRLDQLDVRAGHHGATIPLSGAVAIERSTFDAQLVNAAIRRAARFLPTTLATVENEENQSSGVRRSVAFVWWPTLRRGDGPGCHRGRWTRPSERQASARVRLPNRRQFATRSFAGRRTASGSIPAGRRLDGNLAHGYVGVVRTHDGRGNLAAAIDSAALRSAGSPEDAVSEILSHSGFELPDLFSGERWHGTLPLMRRAERLSSQRIVLLGDAAGYVEPFTGEGIGWAMQSAISAVPTIAATWTAGMHFRSASGTHRNGGKSRTARFFAACWQAPCASRERCGSRLAR